LAGTAGIGLAPQEVQPAQREKGTDMNRYTAVGRLTRAPRLRKAGESDRDVCELRIAIDNGPDRGPTYIDVATFDAQARACAEHLTAGRQVAIDGRLIYREWQAEDGSRRSRHSVIARVEFLSGRRRPSPMKDAAVGPDDEDIPF